MSRRKPRLPDGEVRLLAGQWRGRKLAFPASEGLRPTGARIRETLFNWLMHDIEGARCLDLFAGSGALGFEALSRGASSVIAIEQNRQAARQLETSATGLSAQGYDVYCADALAWLEKQPAIPQDIVFLDPPFADGLLARTARLLAAGGWLQDGALVYAETARAHSLVDALGGLPENWQLHREAGAGGVCFGLFRVRKPDLPH